MCYLKLIAVTSFIFQYIDRPHEEASAMRSLNSEPERTLRQPFTAPESEQYCEIRDIIKWKVFQ